MSSDHCVSSNWNKSYSVTSLLNEALFVSDISKVNAVIVVPIIVDTNNKSLSCTIVLLSTLLELFDIFNNDVINHLKILHQHDNQRLIEYRSTEAKVKVLLDT